MEKIFNGKFANSRMVLGLVVTLGLGLGVSSIATAQEPYIGDIKMVGFNFAQRGWARCDGQLLSVASNSALFSLFGTIYGGDGRTTFALPDCRGRALIHQGRGAGLSDRRIGQRMGQEAVTLSTTQMPSHTHVATTDSTLMATSNSGNSNTPTDRVLANDGNDRIYRDEAPDVAMSAAAITSTTTVNASGGSQAHPNMQPSLVVNFLVALVGIYPSRD